MYAQVHEWAGACTTPCRRTCPPHACSLLLVPWRFSPPTKPRAMPTTVAAARGGRGWGRGGGGGTAATSHRRLHSPLRLSASFYCTTFEPLLQSTRVDSPGGFSSNAKGAGVRAATAAALAPRGQLTGVWRARPLLIGGRGWSCRVPQARRLSPWQSFSQLERLARQKSVGWSLRIDKCAHVRACRCRSRAARWHAVRANGDCPQGSSTSSLLHRTCRKSTTSAQASGPHLASVIVRVLWPSARPLTLSAPRASPPLPAAAADGRDGDERHVGRGRRHEHPQQLRGCGGGAHGVRARGRVRPPAAPPPPLHRESAQPAGPLRPPRLRRACRRVADCVLDLAPRTAAPFAPPHQRRPCRMSNVPARVLARSMAGGPCSIMFCTRWRRWRPWRP
eukprot:347758-Chlamydomonas_euryale.AAC.3